MLMKDNCQYATPLIFFNVYCIFFGFRAFYPQIIQKFVLPLHSHSALDSHSRYRSTKSAGDQGLCSPQKSEIFGGTKKDASHVHRTFIALPSHTRTRVTAMRRSSSAKARSNSSMRFARSRWFQEKIILFNLVEFCSLIKTNLSILFFISWQRKIRN